MKILIANSNIMHRKLESMCLQNLNCAVINSREELREDFLSTYQPDIIFFPHWSYIIPENILNNYKCIIFHMTDLPFGRGGSPLQNLIVRGFDKTFISALRAEKGIDTGPIYLKEELSLNGTAEEIFLRAGKIIYRMIERIIHEKPTPSPQTGNVVIFKRRKPEDGNIKFLETIELVYDYIRMLDAEGYPPAFLETENFRFEFTRAAIKKDSIIADVRIFKK